MHTYIIDGQDNEGRLRLCDRIFGVTISYHIKFTLFIDRSLVGASVHFTIKVYIIQRSKKTSAQLINVSCLIDLSKIRNRKMITRKGEKIINIVYF